MIDPRHPCANCHKQYQYHLDEKCPFEASNFLGSFWFEATRVDSALFYNQTITLKPYSVSDSLLRSILY